MKNKVIVTCLLTVLTANAAYSMPLAFKTSIIKFSFAMAGVLVSSVIIYLGLTVYNKIRENSQAELSFEEEILKTPKTKDDAIRFYIKKNRLR